jgi:hypothetical protein
VEKRKLLMAEAERVVWVRMWKREWGHRLGDSGFLVDGILGELLS